MRGLPISVVSHMTHQRILEQVSRVHVARVGHQVVHGEIIPFIPPALPHTTQSLHTAQLLLRIQSAQALSEF